MSDDTEELDPKEALKRLESERAARERDRISKAMSEWVWVSEATAFVRKSDHLIWSDKQWRPHFAHLQPKGNILTTVLRTPGLIDKYEKLTFEPGQPEIVAEGRAFNLWRPGGVPAKPGDTSWFTDHVRYLLPEERDQDLFLDFLALLVREPHSKILFALLLYGEKHGTGKSAFVESLVRRMLGTHNVRTPSNEELHGTYTAWQLGVQVACVAELMMLGRQEVANRLKPVITDPELRIRAMWTPHYSVPNHLNLLATSNYANAVKIENEDRRWLVLHSPVEPRPDAYYVDLFGHIETDDDVAAVKHLLQHREVKLNPKGRAPLTRAKVEMQEQALPDEERHLIELWESGSHPFVCDLIRRETLLGIVQERFPGAHRDLMGRIDRLLKERFDARQQKRSKYVGRDRPRYQLWSIRNHEKWAKAGPTARLNEYLRYQDLLNGLFEPCTEDWTEENNFGY